VKATPAAAYDKFVHHVGDWWSSDHTYSHDAHNLTMDDKAGGCFCEKLPDGGGVRHLQVNYDAPGKALILSGGMGPLSSMAVTGAMNVTFTAVEGGTKIALTYAVGGYAQGGLTTLAAPVDGMLKETLGRFRSYVER